MGEGEEPQEARVPVDVAVWTEVGALGFENVEDVEDITNGLSVEEDVTGEVTSPANSTRFRTPWLSHGWAVAASMLRVAGIHVLIALPDHG